ncbi:MAG: AI-2E family transporter, partial [Micrococcales bacterium]|nr:AI-2E family transporter [Micrococcales bacterium]
MTNSSDRGSAAAAHVPAEAAEPGAPSGHLPSASPSSSAAPLDAPASGSATRTAQDLTQAGERVEVTEDAIVPTRDHPVHESKGPGTGVAAIAGTLPRVGIVLVILACGWLSVSAVQSLQSIVGPLLLTLNLAIVAYPVQAWLNRYGIPRIIGACVSGAIIFAILLAFFGALGWSLTLLIQEIPQYQSQFTSIYQSVLEELKRFGISETQAVQQLQSQLDPSRVVSLATQTLSGLTGMLSLLLVTVTIIFVVLIDSMNL